MCDGSVRIIGSSPFFNYHKGRKKQGGASVMADTEKIIQKKYDVPIWHKSNLTIDEAVEYSGIGSEYFLSPPACKPKVQKSFSKLRLSA